jgi:ADP-ribose pyrophosphatase
MTDRKMKIVSSKEAYRCKVFRVTEDEASDGRDYHIKRAVIRHPGSAVMLAVDEKKRVLLVRQYRLPAAQYLWELPAGTVDEGESVPVTARRELIEETGLRAKKWKKLTTFLPSPGFSAEKMTIFLATELTPGEAKPMEDERIETKWFTKKELKEMIRNGAITDAKTMIGFLCWAKL